MFNAKAVTAASMAAVFYLLGSNAWAQAEVVDSNNRLMNAPRTAAPTASNARADMFYQLQLLQQEVLELRGQVEEQAYELKRLKQQRLDDYVSFDRRLSALTTAGGMSATVDAAGVESNDGTAPPVDQPAVPEADEVQSYRTAIDLVLRKKDYAQAAVSFQQYLTDFPQGRYAPNSQYWLGEIYLLQNNLELAREWFTRLLNEHATHAKAPDATYKLGTVYDKLGDKAKARQLLRQVADGDTNAARLASAYLAEMNK